MEKNCLMGIDGGGTYTRVAIVNTEGKLLACIRRPGGAFLWKNANANENVCLAVSAAMKEADCAFGDVIALTAGIAGYDQKKDLRWVHKLTKIQGLRCPKEHVNDAVIALRGSLLFKPGIIAIAGTGSVIAGITEVGKFIRNYDFHHYANSAACNLTYNSVCKILAGEADETEFVGEFLRYFGAKDIAALKALHDKNYGMNDVKKMKLFGDFAPTVTAAAQNGSRLAGQVCIQAAAELVVGIRLLYDSFTSNFVSVALVGSVANSTFIKNAISKILQEEEGARYAVVESALPPVLGAVLMAAQLAKIEPETMQRHLLENYHAHPYYSLSDSCETLEPLEQ